MQSAFAGSNKDDLPLPTPRHDYAAAGCVVTDAHGRVLVLGRPGRGEWRLPKGHLDPGEDSRAAALRETREESGFRDLVLGASLGEQWVVFHWEGRVRRRRETYFLAQLRSTQQDSRPPADAAQLEAHSLSPSEAASRLSYAAERNVLAKALVFQSAPKTAPEQEPEGAAG